MTTDHQNAYLDDPLLHSAIAHLQSGEWEAGLTGLDQLVEKYPLSHQLRGLRQEMKIRSGVDADEVADNQHIARQKTLKMGAWAAVLILIVAAMFTATNMYMGWMQEQWAKAQDRIQQDVLSVELAAKFRNGQNLLTVKRLEEAQVIFEEIQSTHPDYPGLADVLNQTQKYLEIEAEYSEAVKLMGAGDMTRALEMLDEIQSKEPYYKDVSIRIAEIKGQFFLGDILAKANRDYDQQNWAEAAAGYETLRALNPQYEADLVDDRLFTSYMNAAVEVLSADSSSLVALDEAEVYFRKALSLRPQDPVIRLEREKARETFKDRLSQSYVDAAMAAITGKADSLDALATAEDYFQKALDLRPDDPAIQTQRQRAALFLSAQEFFNLGQWNDAILALEELYLLDPDYADGTARQTLYDALTAQGDVSLLSTDYDLALANYQRAAVLAGEISNSSIRMFQAQIKIAEVLGILGEYEDAVLAYRTAIQLADINPAELQERETLSSNLNSADRYSQVRNFRSAYRVYRDVAASIYLLFPTVTYLVEDGDYLTSIANRHNTTVEAILKANGLNSSRNIGPGREIAIPVER